MLPLMKTVCAVSAIAGSGRAEQTAKKSALAKIFIAPSSRVRGERSSALRFDAKSVNSFSFIHFAY
jgi:hypothetical protein